MCKLVIVSLPMKSPIALSAPVHCACFQWHFHAIATTLSPKGKAWEIEHSHPLEHREPRTGKVSLEKLITMKWMCLAKRLWLLIRNSTNSCPGMWSRCLTPPPPSQHHISSCVCCSWGLSQNRISRACPRPPAASKHFCGWLGDQGFYEWSLNLPELFLRIRTRSLS